MYRTLFGILAVFGVGLLLGGLVARAAPGPTLPMLAVLDIDASDQSLDAEEIFVLTDAIRGAVVSEVGQRYKVLTRETMERAEFYVHELQKYQLHATMEPGE